MFHTWQNMATAAALPAGEGHRDQVALPPFPTAQGLQARETRTEHSALPQAGGAGPGVTFLQAEFSVFMACLEPVSHLSFFLPSGDLLICNRKVHCFPVWYFFDYLKRNPRGLFSQNSDCIIDVIMMYFAVSLLLGWLFWEAPSSVNAAMCCVCMAWASPPHKSPLSTTAFHWDLVRLWGLPGCKESRLTHRERAVWGQ